MIIEETIQVSTYHKFDAGEGACCHLTMGFRRVCRLLESQVWSMLRPCCPMLTHVGLRAHVSPRVGLCRCTFDVGGFFVCQIQTWQNILFQCLGNMKVVYGKSQHPQRSAPAHVPPKALGQILRLEELMCEHRPEAVNTFLIREHWGSRQLRRCSAEGSAIFDPPEKSAICGS